MDRILKLDEAANNSKLLKDTLLLMQDAETRIKDAIFHSFLTHANVEAIVISIISDSVKKLPEGANKEKFIKDLEENARNWLTIIKTGSSNMLSPFAIKGLPKIIYKSESNYQSQKPLFSYGQPRDADYQRQVIDLAKRMAQEVFKSVDVENGTDATSNSMRFATVSMRAAAERQIRDKIHHDENDNIIRSNDYVWISSHADCSKRCEPWQGKLYYTKNDGKALKTLEGHKVYLLSDAVSSNIVTTRNGNVWNNSILVGFNCRHYTIPFVPGTVPVIKYDPKIIKKEREITSIQRKYERAIVYGKTYHKLLVRAEKEGTPLMNKELLARKKQEARNYYLAMNEKYKAFCSDNKRAYYPWRTQTMINNEFKEENGISITAETKLNEIIDEKRCNQTANNLYNRALNIEKVITGDIIEIGKSLGIKNEGLAFRLKSFESLERKIRSKYLDEKINDLTIEGAANDIKDANRYTYVLDSKDFTFKYKEVNNILLEKGYILNKVKNTFKVEGATYKGINNNYISPSGTQFELQFHTQESFNLKQNELHKLYEEQRADNTSLERKKELVDQMIFLSSKLTIPKDIDKI